MKNTKYDLSVYDSEEMIVRDRAVSIPSTADRQGRLVPTRPGLIMAYCKILGFSKDETNALLDNKEISTVKDGINGVFSLVDLSYGDVIASARPSASRKRKST